MVAVDTNVLVRLLTGDDLKQSAAARSLFASSQIWISKTVLLETDWVLRSRYNFDDETIQNAFTKLLGLKNVHVEDQPAVAVALTLAGNGIELADAIHVSSRPAGAAFVSFDKSLIRGAKRAGAVDVSELSGNH